MNNVLKGFHKRQAGVTLIELMIVIVIISILAAVAVPSYEESVRKSRRAEAMTSLMSVMQQQERFFLNNLSYSTSFAALGYSDGSDANFETENGHYLITAAACGAGIAQCVLLTATPQGGHTGDGTLGLNSQGQKTATGKALSASAWQHD
ncbi:MAG: type IV pilin protein [Pseudomonadales bacterium]